MGRERILEEAITLAEKSRRGFELYQAYEAGTLDPRALRDVSAEEWAAAAQAAEMLDAVYDLEGAP